MEGNGGRMAGGVTRSDADELSSAAYHGKASAITDGIVSHASAAAALRRAGVSRDEWTGKGAAMRAKSPAERARAAYKGKLQAQDAAAHVAGRDAAGLRKGASAKVRAESESAISSGERRDLDDDVLEDVRGKTSIPASVANSPVTRLVEKKARDRRIEARVDRRFGEDPAKDIAGKAAKPLPQPVEPGRRIVSQVTAGKGQRPGTGMGTTRKYGHSAKARKAAAKATSGAGRAAGSRAAAATASVVRAKAASIAASVAGAFGAPVVIGAALCGVVALVLFAAVLGGASQNMKNLSLLDDAERQVAEYLYNIGFGDAQVAGVLAHIQCESGFDPANEFEFGGQGGYAYEVACGLLQYTSTSPGREEYFEYKNWCSETGRDWTDIGTQMYWTFGSHEPPGYWEGRWINRTGYYRAACNQDYPKGNALQVTVDAFLQTSDPQEACYLFMAGYGGGTQNPSQLHLARRMAMAQSYYAKLTSSATGGKAAVVTEAAKHLGKPYVWGAEGPGSFDCSGLTMYCYRVALGIELPHYTEDQLAAATMTVPPEQAEPGDILYKPGHVGISLGGTHCIEAMGARWGVVESDRNVWTCALKFA